MTTIALAAHNQLTKAPMTAGSAHLPVAMMRPGADSLDRIGILRSWRLSS